MKVLYIHFTEIDQDTARHEAGIFVRFARKRFGFVFQVCQMNADGGCMALSRERHSNRE